MRDSLPRSILSRADCRGLSLSKEKTQCWAAKLGGCGGPLSREHLVSRSLFREHPDFHKSLLYMYGFSWCEDEPKPVGISSATSKILCRRHNSALSQLDSEAARAFDILTSLSAAIVKPEHFSKCESRYRINGLLLERWFLKTAINMIQVLYPAVFSPPTELIELAFGLRPFPPKAGLCLAALPSKGKFTTDQGIMFQAITNGSAVHMALFQFADWKFALPLTAEPLPPLLSFIKHRRTAYSPQNEFMDEFGKSTLSYHHKRISVGPPGRVLTAVDFDWTLPVANAENREPLKSSEIEEEP